MRKRKLWKNVAILTLSAGLSVAAVETGIISRAETEVQTEITEDMEVAVESETGVVEVDDQSYASLEEAMEQAADGVVITLTSNISLMGELTVPEGKTIVIDLNGYTITPEDNNGSCVIRVQGDLTIMDSSDDDGKITGVGSSGKRNCTILIDGSSGGTLNIESGVVENGSGAYGIYLAGGQLVVDGGKIEAGYMAIEADVVSSDETDYEASVIVNDGRILSSVCGIGIFGIGKEECPVNVEINGGTIKAENGFAIAGNGSNRSNACYAYTNLVINDGELCGETAIYLPQYGMTEIHGGIITGTETAIEIESGKLEITGGTLISEAEGNIFLNPKQGDGTTCAGAALAVISRTTEGKQGLYGGGYWGEIELSISGGEFQGNYAVFEGLYQGCTTEDSVSEFQITGGEFNGEILLEESLTEKIQNGEYAGI